MSHVHHGLAGLVTRHAVLLTASLFVLLPFVWMVSLSIKSSADIVAAPLLPWPQHFWGWQNYSQALGEARVWRYLLNGAIVCTGTIVLQVAIAAPAAYALAKLEFAGRTALFTMVLVGIAVPRETIAAPTFIICHYLGIIDSYAALILPAAISPFGIFLLRQAFKQVPDEMIAAARLDGFSHLGIVWCLMLPSSLPALATFATLSVVARWNELFWPSIAIFSDHLMPPTVGLVRFRNNEIGSDYGPLMAAAVVVILPLMVLSIFMQRRAADFGAADR